MGVLVTKITGSRSDDWIYNISVTSSLNHTYYSAIADLHTFQSTVAHSLGFPVFTSRLLATDLKTEISTSNHCEVFLLFRLQSLWNLGNELKLFSAASGHVLYSYIRGTDNAETQFYCRPQRKHK
jgi:hypothetical protein